MSLTFLVSTCAHCSDRVYSALEGKPRAGEWFHFNGYKQCLLSATYAAPRDEGKLEEFLDLEAFKAGGRI